MIEDGVEMHTYIVRFVIQNGGWYEVNVTAPDESAAIRAVYDEFPMAIDPIPRIPLAWEEPNQSEEDKRLAKHRYFIAGPGRN